MMACCSETMLKRTLVEAKAKADAADAEWKKARLDFDARRVSIGVVRKAAARASSARGVVIMAAMAAADRRTEVLSQRQRQSMQRMKQVTKVGHLTPKSYLTPKK